MEDGRHCVDWKLLGFWKRYLEEDGYYKDEESDRM